MNCIYKIGQNEFKSSDCLQLVLKLANARHFKLPIK